MFINAIILTLILGCTVSARPEVKIQKGRVRGIEIETFKGRRIYAFYNIPYTQRLTHRRRFEELKEEDPWEGVLDAGGPPVYCPQITLKDEYEGVENCLFMNVYTPVLPNSSFIGKLYPVIVYIHGGAFYFYSGGVHGPRYLLDKDVILVSFNYRIGIPGFGSTEDYVLPGNLGMKDQVKALKWVQRNVHYFSGDRNSVTLFGMSSGAVSVHLHYFSKKSRGLFHRGVIMGGMGTEMWAMNDRPRRRLEKMSRNLGCPTDSSFEMVICLENLPARDLALAVRTIQEGPVPHMPLAPLAPFVDDFSRDPFFLDYPYDALQAGRVAKLPMLVTNAEYEGIFPGVGYAENEEFMRDIDQNWNVRGRSLLELEHVLPAYMNDTLAKIRRHYFGNKAINGKTESAFVKFVWTTRLGIRGVALVFCCNAAGATAAAAVAVAENMITDRYWHTQSVKATILHAWTNPHVYYYLFGYKGSQSTSKLVSKNPEKFGASHIDDLFYMFNVTDKRPLEHKADDILMIERMTTMLATFAKTGRPSFGTNVDFEPVEQRASIFDPIRGLMIRSPHEMYMDDLDIGDVRFWESLPILKPRKTSYFRNGASDYRDS